MNAVSFSLALRLLILLLFYCPLSAQQYMRITEVAATNTGQVTDEDGDWPDWMELRNSGTQLVNLGGWGIGDGNKGQRWLLPPMNLNPGARVLIFASGKNRGGAMPDVHHWETAVYESDVWHYFVGTSNPPAHWATLDFDAAVWPSGPGGFGYGDGDDATVVPDNSPSVYYRRIFQVPDPSKIARAVLSMDYDDGFVAYLNGQEIARSSNIVGQPSWNALATSEHEATFYSNTAPPAAFPLDPALLALVLKPGVNVLAVQVHNAFTNSSDLSGRTWLHFGISTEEQFFGSVPNWFTPGGGSSVSNLHTNFKLSPNETLKLWNAQGNLMDTVKIGQLQPGHSQMRINDDDGWCITTSPTPKLPNGFNCESSYAAPPVFSLEPGFYEGQQLVTLSGGGEIRYTTNGNEPTTSSPLYSAPILVSQNTVIRARRYEQFKLPSATATATYFIDENVTLPVVSVTIKADDFPTVYSNYTGKSPMNVVFFDKNKQKRFEGMFEGYVAGNWSVSFPQKSLHFNVNEDYGSQAQIQYAIFPDKPIQKYHSFRIRNEDDDWVQARMRDRIVNELAAPTHAARASYLNVVAFINGQYWGHYVAREGLDNYFCRDNYGANPDSVNMVKTYYNLSAGMSLDEAEFGSIGDFYAMTDFISNNNLADAANFKKAGEMLDLDNFTDYIITEVFVANTDWLQDYLNNIRLFKNNKNDRWKFLLWDVSYSSGNPLAGNSACTTCDVLGSTLSSTSQYGNMLRSLFQNSGYRRHFINRFADLMNTHFATSRAHALIDRNAAELAPEIPRHHQRWGTGDLAQWSAAVQLLRDFYTTRHAHQRQHIVDHFQLNGTVNLTLNAEPPGAGTIQISTVVPKNMPWSGVYFNGNPVTLTAIPNPGYTFSHWAPNPNISDPEQPSFTADFAANTSLTAHFSGSPENTDLIISEINYNSDSTRNAGDWVEIRNNSSTPIDISGYWMRDSDWFHRFDIPTGTVLTPGGHLVIYESKSKFTGEHPNVTNAIGPFDFKFDNLADEVYLFDRDSHVVAWASYSSQNPWPCSAAGFGSTLERRNANSDPSDPTSWFAGCVGGSPGTAYSSCGYLPALTELNYKSSPNADAGDWIELFNHAAFPINLSGWKIGDGDGNLFTIPSGTLLQPGEHHVFYQDDAKFSARFPHVSKKTGPIGFGLDGNGDHVRLFSATGQLRFDFCYNDAAPWPVQPDGQGYTLEIKDIDGIWNDADNWFAGCPEGSPGQAFDINCGNVSTQAPHVETLRFAISPNPASDMATITPSQPLMPQHIHWSLADQSGRVLASQTGTTLDLIALPNGVYWVWVNGQVLRLVKNGKH